MAERSVEAILGQTRSGDPKRRARALRELCPCELRHDHREVWDRVLEMTGDSDLAVRRGVLHTLIDGSPREREANVISALESMRDDADPRLRRRVRGVLAHYRRTGRVNIG